MSRSEIIAGVFLIAFAAVVMGILQSEHNECRDIGGQMVRTVMWVTCLK